MTSLGPHPRVSPSKCWEMPQAAIFVSASKRMLAHFPTPHRGSKSAHLPSIPQLLGLVLLLRRQVACLGTSHVMLSIPQEVLRTQPAQ